MHRQLQPGTGIIVFPEGIIYQKLSPEQVRTIVQEHTQMEMW